MIPYTRTPRTRCERGRGVKARRRARSIARHSRHVALETRVPRADVHPPDESRAQKESLTMSIVARNPEKYFTPCPEGLHHGVCVDVVDLGLVDTTFGRKHRVRLAWQIADTDPATGRRHDCIKTYTISLHKKATLRADLESWFGRKLTEDEVQSGFDLERLLGVNAMLNILHDDKEDGTVFANVRAIMACPKGTPKLVPLDYTRRQDRPGPSGGSSAPLSAASTPARRPIAPTGRGLPPASPAAPPIDGVDNIDFAFGANVGEGQ